MAEDECTKQSPNKLQQHPPSINPNMKKEIKEKIKEKKHPKHNNVLGLWSGMLVCLFIEQQFLNRCPLSERL